MATEFRLPELGENIEKGDLVKIMVAVGDSVAKDQAVIELETDKATLEVPSSVAGKVKQIHVKQGDKVAVGQLILTVDEEGAGGNQEQAELQIELPGDRAKPLPKAVSNLRPGAYGPTTREQEEAEEAIQSTAPPDNQPAPDVSASGRGEVIDISHARAAAAPEPPQPERPAQLAPASPGIRRRARELGIDINQVRGTGPSGRISEDDITAFAKSIITGAKTALQLATPPPALSPLPDFTRWGQVERKPMSNIRRKTAERMARASSTVAQVTQFDQADVTDLEELRKRFGKKAEASGGKLTVTAVAVKVIAAALKAFPKFRASIDMAGNEIVFKRYVHIGVAVDTDRGLLVPVIRDADHKNIIAISTELAQLSEKARSKKLTPEEMEGGVFTITNLGGIGGSHFTPIVNYPEAAILGISRAVYQPAYRDGQFVPRLILPLSLSYDHRLIDGADAARFLRWVAEALEQPFLLSLEG